MPSRRKPKTPFGKKVRDFMDDTCLTYQQIADLAGVKRNTLVDCTTGKTVGYELIPLVEAFMNDYRHKIALENLAEASAAVELYKTQ